MRRMKYHLVLNQPNGLVINVKLWIVIHLLTLIVTSQTKHGSHSQNFSWADISSEFLGLDFLAYSGKIISTYIP